VSKLRFTPIPLIALAVVLLICGMAVGIYSITQQGPDPIPVDDNPGTVKVARDAITDQDAQAKQLADAKPGTTAPIMAAIADDQAKACEAITELTTPTQDLLDYQHSHCDHPTATAPTTGPTVAPAPQIAGTGPATTPTGS
jgi:hypothetical protein